MNSCGRATFQCLFLALLSAPLSTERRYARQSCRNHTEAKRDFLGAVQHLDQGIAYGTAVLTGRAHRERKLDAPEASVAVRTHDITHLHAVDDAPVPSRAPAF